MFISCRSHDLIVAVMAASSDAVIAELRAQIALLQKTHDREMSDLCAQLDEIEGERDWYRKEWTRSRGKAFTSKTDPPETPMPLFDQSSTEPPFDDGWTVDDRDLFNKWSARLAGTGIEPEEEWKRKYGGQSPLVALTV